MSHADQVYVGIVAADPMRLLGLEAILEESKDLIARPVSLEEALSARDLSAVLLDSACVANLMDTLKRFRRRRPATKLVVLGVGGEQDLPGHIQAVIAAGAKGFLLATASEADVRMAVEVVLDGSVWAPRKVLARLIEAGGATLTPGEGPDSFSQQMTRRELEVLWLLMDGRTNRQIADTMGIEPVTVKAHMGRMLRKAGVKNRVELTLKAMAETSRDDESRRA